MTSRCNRDPTQVRDRLTRLWEPHVAPLSQLVEQIRSKHGGPDSVPWFDPTDAGLGAEILLLSEAPGPRAMGTNSLRSTAHGSGIISVHNDDPTAATTYDLRIAAGLADPTTGNSSVCLHWNIVPWYIGDAGRIRNPTLADLRAAQAPLKALIALLPDLRAVVLMGRASQRGWSLLSALHPQDVVVVPSPHPSPQVVNTNPAARDRIARALGLARMIAEVP